MIKPVNTCLQCAAYRGSTPTEGLCLLNPPSPVNGHVSAYPIVKASWPGCFQAIPKAKSKAKAKPRAKKGDINDDL